MEDDYDCNIMDNIDSDHEAQYKDEFDMLDTDSDGSISVAENNQAILDTWKKNYGMFCNDNAEDTKKYGLWNQLGKLLQSTKQKGGVSISNIASKLNNLFRAAAQTFMKPQTGRRLQHHDHHDSHHGPPNHHWNHGRGGWGQDKDVDCSQQLSNKAAFAAAHAMHVFDTDGDRKISFCEYATQRSKSANTVVVHGN